MADEAKRRKRSHQSADAHGGGQVADRARVCPEHAEDRDDDQNVEAPANKRLREHEPRHEARPASAKHHLKAGHRRLERAPEGHRGRRADAALDPHAREQ
jgi:hypothetical protein